MTDPQASLSAQLPKPGEPKPTADDILGRFVSYAAAKGLELYSHQEEAILELIADKHLVLKTPTGSGKSLVATALIFKARCEGRRAFYTAPIKALVNEKFFDLCEAFGPEQVGMLTGDASINRDAPIIVCTAEILSNLALRDPDLTARYVVMDEFHYYGDPERGVAWQVPLIALPQATFLLMSATLGDTTAISERLTELTGREVATVQSAQRPVPLDFEYSEKPLHEAIQDLLKTGRYPIYLVNFTQRAAAEQAQNLMSVDFSTKEEKEQLKLALQEVRFDTPYGKDFQRFLRHGVGLHHAGLLPKYRLLVEKLSQSGLLKVVSGTDTLGVGVNIPIRTVLFTQLCKFDGNKVGILSVREFHQIAGRAGRKGFDDRGAVVVQAPEHVIENKRLEEKGGKKVVKKQPPQKGYVHWDRKTYEKLLGSQPEPLESRFTVTHGMLLNLLQAPELNKRGGYGRLVELIRHAHGRDYDRRQHRRRARRAFKSLRDAGLVSTEPRSDGGKKVVVSPALQKDFSLNQTLSLYLLDTLDQIPRESETYALDVVTLVESVLENPSAVLFKQVDKAKDEKMAEMKAQGMEYDERIAELEKVTYPKPNADFIYTTFNAFAQKHPWVGEENIRPKSVVREMFEKYTSFHDYVREYGLQRSEGVLLRYVSEVYKTLAQNVPEAKRTEELDVILTTLRSMLRQVDSSLLDEWESLVRPGAAPVLAGGPVAPVKPPLAEDPRALAARLRTEAHALLRALAAKDYADAATRLRDPHGGASQPEHAWTPEKLEEALKPYWAEHPAIDVTPRARRPAHTLIRPEGPKRWVVQQRIFEPGPESEGEWMLDCLVDLTGPEPTEEQPLLELRRIGT